MVGNDYVFYSDIHLSSVFELFKTNLAKLWPSYIFDDLSDYSNESYEFSFYRDKAMEYWSDEHAFLKDENGESFIMLMGSKLVNSKFNVIVKQEFIDKEDRDVESYSTRFILKDIYMYTLTIPESIEENSFSKRVYELFLESVT